MVTSGRDEWERTFNICWGGVYNCTRAFLPMLQNAEENHIVNTSSINGFWASVGPSPIPPIRPRNSPSRGSSRPNGALLGPLIGLTTGHMNGATGIFVVPSVPYVQALNLGKDELVQALAISALCRRWR